MDQAAIARGTLCEQLMPLKSNLHCTRGITTMQVASGGIISVTKHLNNSAPKKHCSGGEPLATLCPI